MPHTGISPQTNLEIQMGIDIDSWQYHLWHYTFFFSDSVPEQTTRRRFWLRMMFLPLPVSVGFIGLSIIWAVVTLIVNLFSILSGRGVFVTWAVKTHIREFDDIAIGNTLVTGQEIAIISWMCFALVCLCYVYPQVLFAYWWFAAKIVISIVLVAGLIYLIVAFADGREEKDEGRLMRRISEARIYKRPIPDEIVVFVEPNDDIDIEAFVEPAGNSKQ